MASFFRSRGRRGDFRFTWFPRRRKRVKWMRDQGPALAFILVLHCP